jgi:branched-chain amino acid transport system substrate-binding protein
MHRALGSLALLSALSLVAAGCSAGEDKSTTDEIRIGVSIELTGPDSAAGPAHKNALVLAADEINRSGLLDGKQLRLIIKDNKSDPAEALARVNGFLENDNVTAIIGGGTSPTTLSVVDAIEKAKVPLVSMASTDDVLTPREKRRHVFKTPPSPAPVVEVMLRDFRAANITRVGLLAVADAYGDAGAKAVREGAEREGLALVGTERFRIADQAYTGQLTRLIAQKPDAIVVWSVFPGAAKAARDVKKLGYKGRVYFDAGAGAELFVRDASLASEGTFMVHPSVLAANQVTATTPSVLAQKEFFSRYTQRYGTFSGFASYAADALGLIAAAIEQTGSIDRRALRDKLETIRYDGLTGSYEFRATNHGGAAGDALTVLTVRGGGWVLAQ